MGSPEAVTEHNAYRFADLYQIVKTEFDSCVGTEHNEQEAMHLVAWLNNHHGGGYEYRRNTPDQVRAARAMGREPIPMKCRETAFEETGLWPSKRKAR
jgi:hypothetical protein